MKNYTDQLKHNLKKFQPVIGGWITMSDPIVVEIMTKAGFDWLAVDMEHSALTLEQVQNHVRTIESAGLPALVRVGENDGNLIKRVMDTGASGVIVPMVNTKQEAQKAVQSVRYPLKGTRGVGLGRATDYGFNFPAYKDWANQKSVVIVQIEHIDGVNHIDEILQVEGIDAFMVGPYDLSGSLGFPGEFDHPKVSEALKKVLAASRRFGIPAGFHVIPPDFKVLLKKVKEGYHFLAFSMDILFLGTSCRRALDEVRGGLKK